MLVNKNYHMPSVLANRWHGETLLLLFLLFSVTNKGGTKCLNMSVRYIKHCAWMTQQMTSTRNG